MAEFAEIFGDFGDLLAVLTVQLKSAWFFVQVGILVAAALLAAAIAALVCRRLDLITLTMGWPAMLRLAVRTVIANLGIAIFLVLVGLVRLGLLSLRVPSQTYLLIVAIKLSAAWLVINLVAGLIHNRFVVRLVAISAWMLAALSILGILEPTAEALDALAMRVGGLRISVLLALKALVLLLLGVWAAMALSGFIETRLRKEADLTASMQVLIGKLARVLLITVAILMVLASVGIDLSAFAVFSGAVGVGVGFGLQKVVSNIVSGVILLADKSIKPGDVITVGDSFGTVSEMGTRYVAVITRDGREVLIPNEDLVTHRVTNWSYTKDEIRLEVKFGVDPANDPHHVRAAAVQAAGSVSRVLKKLPPVCHFLSLDGRSMEFSLRFWIDDPDEGVTNVRGQVLLALWDAFQAEHILFPSPIQDLRLRGATRVAVEERPEASAREPTLMPD